MPKRRGAGEGCIFAVCRRCRKTLLNGRCPTCGGTDVLWGAVGDLGRGPDGKRRRKFVYGKTRKDVAERLKKLLADIQAGTFVDPGRLTVAQFLERWLEDAARHTVRPVTYETYRRYLRVHAIPVIGHLRLAKIQPTDLQHLYASRLQAGKSRRTIEQLHAILHRAFDQAVKWGLLARNPADAVDAPRPTKRQPKVLTPPQAEQLMKALAGDRLAAMWYLALATGLRRAELVALRWTDLDLDNKTLRVERTAEEVEGQGLIWTPPKTEKGRRQVLLPDEAVALLRRHRARQAEERLKLGPGYQDHGLVYCWPDGRPLRPSWVTRRFRELAQAAGAPPGITLHKLRHTHVTFLFLAGVHPKVVQERLGHSTITVTLDTYTHVLPTIQEEVVQKLNALLPKASEAEADVNG